MTFTAEKAALKNLRKGIMPPKTATEKTPYYDFIGAQMRGGNLGVNQPRMSRDSCELCEIGCQHKSRK